MKQSRLPSAGGVLLPSLAAIAYLEDMSNQHKTEIDAYFKKHCKEYQSDCGYYEVIAAAYVAGRQATVDLTEIFANCPTCIELMETLKEVKEHLNKHHPMAYTELVDVIDDVL